MGKRKTQPEGSDEAPSLVSAIEQVVVQRTEGIDSLDVEEIRVWMSKEVRRLLGRLSTKIWYKRQKGRPIEVNRMQYVAACKVLGVAESVVGQPVDVDGARIAKRALVKFLHPDANGGDGSKIDRYQQVIDAFDTVEHYSKLVVTKPARRPYKKRAPREATG
jgi:hypothetical protein